MENLLLGNVIESGNISPFSCPFCGYNGSLDLMGADRFPVLRTLQVIGAGRRAARCPKCKSSDKERLRVICKYGFNPFLISTLQEMRSYKTRNL